MGNIADALEKAGVDLVDQTKAQQPKVYEEVATEVQPNHEEKSADYLEERVEEKEVKPAVSESTSPEPTELAEKIEPVETVVDEGPVSREASDGVSREVNESQPLDFSLWDDRINMVSSGEAQASEAFRVLRSRILFPQDGKVKPKSIMIISSAPSEGKSFVSVNLAIAIARGLDQHALLVDCDLRYPSLAKLLGKDRDGIQGLTEYLEEEVNVRDLILKTSIDKLSLLPSGAIPDNPAELLSSIKMSQLVKELAERYADRFVIFDSPPYQVASESSVMTQNVDGVVIVVGYGKSNRNKIKTMIEEIGEEKIFGIVFNGMKESYLKTKLLDPYGGDYAYYYGPKKK